MSDTDMLYMAGLQKRIEALEKENAELKESKNNIWISVDDRVPDVSGNYLCYCAYGEEGVIYFDREIDDGEYNNDYPFGYWSTYPSEDGGECREWIEILEVTHWQPLPEPPEGGAPHE